MDLRCLRHRFRIPICIGLRSPSHQHMNNFEIIPNHRKKREQEYLIRQDGDYPHQEFFHSLDVFKSTAKIKKGFRVQNGPEKQTILKIPN